MDDIEKLKQDVREGRIDPIRLVDLLAGVQHQLHAALQRISELEKLLPDAPAPKVDEPFSLNAEEKRQQQRGKKKRRRKQKNRRGRIPTADKIAQAERTEKVFPEGVPPSDCHLSHTRPIWRLEQGRAVLVAYEVYRGPHNQYGQIPGTLQPVKDDLAPVFPVC
jgi:transposase